MPASYPASGPRRRAVITIPLAAVAATALGGTTVLAATGCTDQSSSTPNPTDTKIPAFFTPHEAAVVEAATARIAPGPQDDPAEKGHPGAREANVTGYIDTMLGALTALNDTALNDNASTPRIFAGGPWSNRHTSGPDLMARFASLDPVAKIAWRRRLTTAQHQYRTGIATLDRLAGGDFTKAGPSRQDKILASSSANQFTALLFEHTIEGLYAAPEYGGNRGQAGWKDIAFPGDIQPRGYTTAEVERSDGPDPLQQTKIITDVLKLLNEL